MAPACLIAEKNNIPVLIDVLFVGIIYVILELVFPLFGFQIKSINVKNFTHVDFESENIKENV